MVQSTNKLHEIEPYDDEDRRHKSDDDFNID